jgi:GT2 family glycosyltransferase
MNKVTIVSVVYQEPEWQQTKKDIEACGVPVVYVERSPPGVGSLAEAINRGFKEAPESEFVWFVTNVTFEPSVLNRLLESITDPSLAAVHPSFLSDHAHLRPMPCTFWKGSSLKAVPFVEFTAPLVRAEIFKNHLLDEKMPYVGHDMAWGYEMRELGYKVAVEHMTTLGHTYIRHRKGFHPVTHTRRMLRRKAVNPTILRLIQLYGADYKSKLQYQNAL